MAEFNQKGQTLVEILFAATVTALVLVAVAGATIRSIQSVSFAKAEARGASLVEQGMENARIARDQNTWSFFTNPASWPPNETFSGGFTRITTPTFSYMGDVNKVLVDVVVVWTDSRGSHQRSSQTILSQWK